jgi:hypothetical protein
MQLSGVVMQHLVPHAALDAATIRTRLLFVFMRAGAGCAARQPDAQAAVALECQLLVTTPCLLLLFCPRRCRLRCTPTRLASCCNARVPIVGYNTLS